MAAASQPLCLLSQGQGHLTEWHRSPSLWVCAGLSRALTSVATMTSRAKRGPFQSHLIAQSGLMAIKLPGGVRRRQGTQGKSGRVRESGVRREKEMNGGPPRDCS